MGTPTTGTGVEDEGRSASAQVLNMVQLRSCTDGLSNHLSSSEGTGERDEEEKTSSFERNVIAARQDAFDVIHGGDGVPDNLRT